MEVSLISRLEAVVARLESMSLGMESRTIENNREDSSTDPMIVAFDDLMRQYFGRVCVAAEMIGGSVLQVTKIIEQAFNVEKELLIRIKQSQKPDIVGLNEFLKPLNEVIVKANSMTEGRKSDHFNHSKTAADSLVALAWIAYAGKDCGMSMPVAHIEESWQMAEFYNNKILVEYKCKDPNHVEWAKALKELYLLGLKGYVKTHHPLGPPWNSASKGSCSLSKSTTLSVAPSPAPCPLSSSSLLPVKASPSSPLKPTEEKKGLSAVFQEINSGKSVTDGLRKVTDNMKTKNRTDRFGGVSAREKGRTNSTSFSKDGPPKLELQMGRKWVVENQVGKKNLVIDDCDAKQSVYIFGCRDSIVHIQGKVNNITIDKCSKLGVVFLDVVAACEIVNCSGVEVQCQGTAPSISVDTTSGCQLYLSKDSLGSSISTAKSSQINVLVPAAADGDWVEHGLPEQFIHVYKTGRVETTPVTHSAG